MVGAAIFKKFPQFPPNFLFRCIDRAIRAPIDTITLTIRSDRRNSRNLIFWVSHWDAGTVPTGTRTVRDKTVKANFWTLFYKGFFTRITRRVESTPIDPEVIVKLMSLRIIYSIIQ